MFEFGKLEKQAEILIDKYYSCAKVIYKVVLDIYRVAVLVKVCYLTVYLNRLV